LGADISDPHTARNFDPLGVHPAIVIREKRRDHRSDIVGQAGRPNAVISATRLLASGLSRTMPLKVSLDRARCNDVRGDPARTEFLGQIASQYLDRSLRGAVHRTAGQSKSRES
jgi:hypothetical protein